MGLMVNKKTYEVQNVSDESTMIENGWSNNEWEFVEDIKDFSGYSSYLKGLILKKQITLVEKNYNLKASVAYTGVLYDYNNGENIQEVLFQTNSASSSLIASTHISFEKEGSTKESVNWKLWTVGLPANYPIFITLTKDQFLQFYDFTENMISNAVDTESEYNTKIQKLSIDDLNNDIKIEEFITEMTSAYEAINTKITLK